MSKRVIDGPVPYEMGVDMKAMVAAMVERADRDAEEVGVDIHRRKARVDVIIE